MPDVTHERAPLVLAVTLLLCSTAGCGTQSNDALSSGDGGATSGTSGSSTTSGASGSAALASGASDSGGSAAGGGGTALIPVEPREGAVEVVDVLEGAPSSARPGCSPAPDGVVSTQRHFEVEPVSAADQTFVLDSTARVLRFYDDETELSLRPVHRVYERSDGVFADEGIPYLKVGDSCLELIHRVELQSGGYRFTVTNEGCRAAGRSAEDYVYLTLASCTIRVQTNHAEQAEEHPGSAHHSLFQMDDRFETLLSKSTDGQLLALRSTGTVMGNVDISVTPPDVRGAQAGLDIITPFGVANLEIDYYDEQVIGAAREVTLGPQRFTVTIADIGNINTHCHTGSCKNVLDLDVLSTPTGISSPVRILSYE